MMYLTFVIGFILGVTYKAGKLDGVILWSQQRAVAWYAWATKPKEAKAEETKQ